MVFSSTIFIFAFLPAVLLLYLISSRTGSVRLMNGVLLIFSMVFYAFGGMGAFLNLLLIVFLNYVLTIIMEGRTGIIRKSIFILILLIDMGNLFYFKYFNFFIENINQLSFRINGNYLINGVPFVALPIGISFYTFQILSYVVDVYKGEVEIQRNPFYLALYIMMFPQLIAGPIVRYKSVNKEISERSLQLWETEEGIKRFIRGFAKKVFLANEMGVIADVVFAMNGTSNMLYAWLGALCYTFQIYFDFSAYSDMAIGIGWILGFHFNENFNMPYICESIKDYWRRWHLSLSTWFRDYVYIPLGGNRKGAFRTCINLSLVFFLTGLWHGAAWHYIVWGIYNGFFLLMERIGFGRVLERLPRFIRRLYSMLIVITGFVFFRADKMSLVNTYLGNMYGFRFEGFNNLNILPLFDGMFVLCFAVCILISMFKLKLDFIRQIRIFREGNISMHLSRIIHILLWVVSVLYLTGLSYNPFIYFKF